MPAITSHPSYLDASRFWPRKTDDEALSLAHRRVGQLSNLGVWVSPALFAQCSTLPPNRIQEVLMHPALTAHGRFVESHHFPSLIQVKRVGEATVLALPGEDITQADIFPEPKDVGFLPAVEHSEEAVHIDEMEIGHTTNANPLIKTGNIITCLVTILHDPKKQIAFLAHMQSPSYLEFAILEEMLKMQGVNIQETRAYRLKTTAAEPSRVSKLDYMLEDRGIEVDPLSANLSLNPPLDIMFCARTGKLMVVRDMPNFPKWTHSPHMEEGVRRRVRADMNWAGDSNLRYGNYYLAISHYRTSISNYAHNGLAYIGLIRSLLALAAEEGQKRYDYYSEARQVFEVEMPEALKLSRRTAGTLLEDARISLRIS